jgi:hypothetical protein
MILLTTKLLLLLALSLARRGTSLRTSFALVRDSLATYKRLHGDLKVPYKFVVPNETDDGWPDLNKGQKPLALGKVLSRIRCRGDYMQIESQREELLALGVKLTSMRDAEFETIIEALRVYRDVNGDCCDVSVKFVVPPEDRWPVHLHGYNLGARVHSIRYQGAYSDINKKERLLEIGFNHSQQRRRYGPKLILQALRCYKAKVGDVNVPIHFVVPGDSGDFPEETYDMKLGACVMHIRNRGDYPELREDLDLLGFEWVVWRDKEFRAVLEQLAFKELEALDDEGMDQLMMLSVMGRAKNSMARQRVSGGARA